MIDYGSKYFDAIRFCKLRLDDDSQSMLLLGYRVELTRTECLILKLIYKSAGGMALDDIAELCMVSQRGIPVHIARINKKALPISGRRLIVLDIDGKYRISETM